MSAKLQQALAVGKLQVVNKTSGELSLYYKDPATGKLAHMVLAPHTNYRNPINLLQFAPVDAWRTSPNLRTQTIMGFLDIIL